MLVLADVGDLLLADAIIYSVDIRVPFSDHRIIDCLSFIEKIVCLRLR